MEELEEAVSRAFAGGERRRRELRLTPGEADYVARTMGARVADMGDGWYDISFGGVENE